MNYRSTLHILGGLTTLLSICLLFPIPLSVLDHDQTWIQFLIAFAITFLSGVSLFLFLKPKNVEMGYREAFSVVTFSWIFFSIFGALPYLLCGITSNPVDAIFEAMSGFTTTGSTVLENIDHLPRSVLFWRSFTQWLGGMGIIVLSLAILPFLGLGGMQLFYAETPGPTKDRLTPRIQDTAKLLWGVYVFLTLSEWVLLWIAGMPVFEALCHSMSTLSTGGFSTHDLSVGAYGSYTVHWIITVFMLIAGTNFSLHYRALRGEFSSYFKSQEFILYISLYSLSALLITFLNYSGGMEFWKAFHSSAFQAISIGTGTGYTTADYETWSNFTQTLLLVLMLFGGCAGSTAGGMKIVRLLLILKYTANQLFHIVHPKAVRALKLDKNPVSDSVMQTILGFAGLFFGIFLISVLLVSATGEDMMTSISAVITCICNVGPGFGVVGPTKTFADLSDFAKLVLWFCMLIGRLEFYTVLVILLPSFWKK